MNRSRVVIEYFPTQVSADVAREELSAAGIDSSLKGDDAGGWVPSLGLAGGGLALMVDEDRAEDAKAILDTLA